MIQLLYVCHGNQCRSPYLHLVTRHELARRGIASVIVESAGTDAVAGRPVAEPVQAALAARTVDATGFRSRRLTAEQVTRAQLVLTADRRSRAAVARLVPLAAGRTFTVLQVRRLLPTIRPLPHEVDQLVHSLAAARGLLGPTSADDDIVDPWLQRPATYRRAIAAMQDALVPVVDVLAGVARHHASRP
ncbi:hypothetical protein [Microlunatus sp. Y2014]|uniref:arsenate reductase/protein-tyrosine-phosphatase family protein n=1 Tax=Microlunatus sp. Y2014 TaxID=3418488 RepID=UPI003DA7618C